MIHLIPSQTVKDYIDQENISFTDEELAAIIYNLELDLEKIHDLLNGIAQKTTDVILKKQIEERITYDKKCLALIEEHSGCYYEVSIEGEKQWEPIGCFATLELAKKYGMKKQVEFEVKKHEIATTEEKEDYDYELAGLGYDKDGGIQYFYTIEQKEEENAKVNQRGRFEEKFVEVPNPFEKGDIVYLTRDSKQVGIVETSQEEWKNYLQRVRETKLTPYWHDSAITICFFNEKLEAFHDHVNPLFLEKVEVEEIDEEKRELLQAGSDLMKGKGSLSYFLYLLQRG